MIFKNIHDGKMLEYGDIFKTFGSSQESSSSIIKVKDFCSGKTYNVGPGEITRFYKGYFQALYNKDKTKWEDPPIFSLGEEIGSTMPLTTEFKFSFSDKNKDSLIDEKIDKPEFVQKMITVHQETIKEFFVLGYNQAELLCAVTRSQIVRKENRLFFKTRFQFPYCRSKKSFFGKEFKKRLFEKIDEIDKDDMFHLKLSEGKITNHIQEMGNFYPLYGSTKDKNFPPLLFEALYGEKVGESHKEYSLNGIYKATDHSFLSSNYIDPSEITHLERDLDDIGDEYELSILTLPLFLSCYFYSTLSRHKKTQETVPDETVSQSISSSEKNDDEYDEITPYEMFIDLAECLSPKRFNTFIYMIDIGKCLFNCFEGTEEGLKCWSLYARQKSQKYTEEFCKEHYYSFSDGNFITVRTIGWYAKEDNLRQYQLWHTKFCMPKMKQTISRKNFPHVLTAQSFYRYFWLDYVYAGGKYKKWYRFKNNRLCELSDDEPIRRDITEKFVPCFDNFRNQYLMEKIAMNEKISQSEKAKRMTADFEKTIQTIGDLIDKLLSNGYRNSLMMTIREYFYQEDFFDMIDKNPNILGVYNCVIELTKTGAFARPGKPEDYVTKRMGVSYRSEYDENHRDVRDILKYLRQVFPEKSLFEHMQRDISSMLYGKNSEKCFRVWIGDTNGSKSVFQKMLKKMFGDYYKDMPNEFYSATQKNSSGPNPEIAQLSNARIVFSAEPDGDAAFKGDRIKKITGGDSFFGRGCKQDGGSIETSFKTVMVLNNVPDISNLDEATKERFKMIPFEGRWAKEEEDIQIPESFEEQIQMKTYRMDKKFEDNIPRLAMALLWLSVKNYKFYAENGLTNPEYIKKWMKDYWKMNDPYLSFINEKLIKIEKEIDCEGCSGCKKCCDGKRTVIDETVGIRTKDIYHIFRNWLKDTHPHMRMINQGAFTKTMSTRDKLGKQVKWLWAGWKIKASEDEA